MTQSAPAKGHDYFLARNYAAATRLNLQHFMWKDAQGFLLHPAVRAHLQKQNELRQGEDKPPVNVVDLATGTGIWLFDLINSEEIKGLDAIQYYGFDISNTLFPHNAWLPKNVVLSTSDLLEDPPKALHGKFDVLHARLILSLVENADPSVIIQNMNMLLKPGGYLQWDEEDLVNHHEVLTPEPETQAPKLKAAVKPMKDLVDSSWVSKLTTTLEQAGFEDVTQTTHVPRAELLKVWTCMDLCTIEELGRNGIHRANEESAAKLQQILPEANAEADATGAVIQIRPTVTIARKRLV